MTLDQWATRHAVTPAALAELRSILTLPDVVSVDTSLGTSEAAVQARVRVAASQQGWRLWRNNIGAGHVRNDAGDETFMRWGLANDSKALNAAIKSGDLIGIRPVVVTSRHVGQIIGQFVSLECKAVGWKFTGSERELAQQKWAALVLGLGGHATFTTGAV